LGSPRLPCARFDDRTFVISPCEETNYLLIVVSCGYQGDRLDVLGLKTAHRSFVICNAKKMSFMTKRQFHYQPKRKAYSCRKILL
jgi:hypothetical protein